MRDASPAATPNAKPSRRLVLGHLLQVGVTFLVIGAVLFLSAGRLDWWEAWAFLIVYFLIALVTALWMLGTNPALTQERDRPGRNVKSWDNLLVLVNLVLTIALFVVIGVDAGRLDGARVPLPVRAIGLLGLVPAFGLPLWAAKTNAYLSSRVRIQDDRGHQVISIGPYHYIRHPMYAGMIFYDVSLPLLLGSWWALAVGGLMIGVVIVRTALEDATLRRELPGYEDYSRNVRYRLFPIVW